MEFSYVLVELELVMDGWTDLCDMYGLCDGFMLFCDGWI
jgi:hypothetical protein